MNSNKITSNREEKYRDLKKRIAWACCGDLLNPPLPPLEPLRYSNTDDPELKSQKKAEYHKKVEEREKERMKREPELIEELDRVIERVRSARSEYNKSGLNYNAIAEAQRIFKFDCERCRNRDPENTILDTKSGDRICLGKDGQGCGQVLQDHQVNLGAAKRNFEGEEEKNHFGPAPNNLMSDAWNMSTSLSTTKNGREDATYKRLLQTVQIVEMDLSNIGSNEHRTREGYKNKQKREAFEMIENLSDSLGIHQCVRDQAKEEFCRYRDLREAVQQYNAVVASCILLAYKDLSGQRDVDIKTKVFTGPRLAFESPPSVVVPNSNDPAEFCLSEIPLSKWSLSQVQEWLLAVSAGIYDDYANAIYNRIESLYQSKISFTTTSSSSSSSSGSNTKYDVRESFLGTTTKEGRNKRMETQNDHSHASSAAGKYLITLKLSSITEHSTREAEDHFVKAIRRRSNFEIRLRDFRETAAKEALRLTHETSGLVQSMQQIANKVTKVISTNGNEVAHGNNSDKLHIENGNQTNLDDSITQEDSNGITEVDLDELFGGSVNVSTKVVPVHPNSSLSVESSLIMSPVTNGNNVERNLLSEQSKSLSSFSNQRYDGKRTWDEVENIMTSKLSNGIQSNERENFHVLQKDDNNLKHVVSVAQRDIQQKSVTLEVTDSVKKPKPKKMKFVIE